jgi:hypothetical protein
MLFISFIELPLLAPYIGCVAVHTPLQILVGPRVSGSSAKERERVMTRVNTHIADGSLINGRIVGFLSTLALVLAGILTMASFAAI